MEVAEIPIVANASHFVQENEIFKKSFFLEFEWIEKESFWALHISNAEQNPLALGVKLQTNWPLYIHQQGESGFIISLQQIAAGASLSRENLNTHFVLAASVAHVPSI